MCLCLSPYLDGRGIKDVEAAVRVGVVDELVEVLIPELRVLEVEVAAFFLCFLEWVWAVNGHMNIN